MSEDKLILLKSLSVPVPDALIEWLRGVAQQLLAAAIEAGVNECLERFQHKKTADGHQRLIRPAEARDPDWERLSASTPAGLRTILLT